MSLYNSYDRTNFLGELLNPLDTQLGVLSAATQQAKTRANLGLGSGSGLGPLPAGTATIAPLSFTAGINLTTAAAGAVEYDGNAFYATAAAASRQQIDGEQFTILAANYVLTDVNTAQKALNASTNGAITLVAGKTYLFELMYDITNTGTTSHTWALAFGGTATFTAGNYQAYGNSSATANAAATGGLSGFFSGTTLSTAVVLTAASTSATEQVALEAFGTIVVNASGTLIPQVKLSAATTGVETMLAGSFFRIWEMSSSATVGNWS